MPVRVRVEGHGIVEFPDGMSKADMEAALQQLPQAKGIDLQMAPKAAPQPEQKSLGGFLGNILPSLGQFAMDTVTGLPKLAKAAVSSMDPRPQARAEQGRQIMGTLRAIPKVYGERYGSLEKAGNTFYSDPIGALADVSTVTGAGSALAGTRAPALAGKLRLMEQATNPVSLVKPLATATEYGTAAAIRPMLAPPTSVVRQSRAPLEIERTALRAGAVTEGGARKKLKAATTKTTQAADRATEAGVTVPRSQVAQFPNTLKKTEQLTPNIRELDDLAALESEVVASLPENITPSELLSRRRALDEASDTAYRAEERGGYIRSTRDKGQKELGNNMRTALREVAPDVRESDDLARRLGMVAKALENANVRPKGFPMSAALSGAAGGYFAGGPAAATLGAGVGIGRTFPQIPLALGSIPVRGTAALADAAANPLVSRSALVAALIERLTGESGQ